MLPYLNLPLKPFTVVQRAMRRAKPASSCWASCTATEGNSQGASGHGGHSDHIELPPHTHACKVVRRVTDIQEVQSAGHCKRLQAEENQITRGGNPDANRTRRANQGGYQVRRMYGPTPTSTPQPPPPCVGLKIWALPDAIPDTST